MPHFIITMLRVNVSYEEHITTVTHQIRNFWYTRIDNDRNNLLKY